MVTLQIPTGRLRKAQRMRRAVERSRLQRIYAAAMTSPHHVLAALAAVEDAERAAVEDETVRMVRR